MATNHNLQSKALEKREQALQKRRQEELRFPLDLEILRESQNEGLSLKKMCILSRNMTQVGDCCYVLEQNLLAIVLKNTGTVRMYNAASFKAIETKKCERSINAVRYLAHFERLFLGGDDFCMEVYNPQTRQTELKSKLNPNNHIIEIVELRERNAIAVGTKNRNIHILSGDLTVLCKINVSAFCDEPIQEIFDLQSNFLLVTRQFFNKKRISLCNLSTRKMIDFPDIEIALSSSLEVCKQDSTNIITCLANIPGKAQSRSGRFRLVQFAQEAGLEDLVLYRTTSKTKEFSDLRKIKDSEYFAARFFEGSSAKVAIIKVTGERIQPMKLFPGTDCDILQLQLCMVMKKSSSLMIGNDKSGNVCVYDCKEKTDQEAKGSRTFFGYFNL